MATVKMFISYYDIQGYIRVDDFDKLRTTHQLSHQNHQQRLSSVANRSIF